MVGTEVKVRLCHIVTVCTWLASNTFRLDKRIPTVMLDIAVKKFQHSYNKLENSCAALTQNLTN